MKDTISTFPEVVSPEEWETARQDFLKKEKTFTRQYDALNAERRRLPMTEVKKQYRFEGPEGEVSLLDLFAGRRQLLIYHFMFAPTVHGWPDAGCVGCSMFADNAAHTAHLQARDTSLVMVSLAPLENITRYKKRMGWTLPWYSSANNDFNKDFHITTEKNENPGMSVFIHDGDRVFRTYFTTARGTELLGTIWSLLDLTPLGRQERWEDTPEGRPQGDPYVWWRRHDEYDENPK